MATKKYFKDLGKRLIRAGYSFSHATASGDMWVYAHPVREDISIKPDIGEGPMLKLSKQLDAEFKAGSVAKRNASDIRKRHAAERAKLKEQSERLEAERASILAQKDSLPVGEFDGLTSMEIRKLEQRIAQIDSEFTRIARMMTELPVPTSGVKRARHTAGGAT
ncbi:hypothetical protein [Rhodococcus jostii]|uniref:hypothetical protein n=1 Tax=Rhodococcus jostii TaxID=132919 RepID=UPI0036422E47